MMDVTVKTSETKVAKYLGVEAGVRYWEDGEIDGVSDDNDAPRMPFAKDGIWRPVIDIDTGKIEGWPAGVRADVHYKVCDDGRYVLLDENRAEIVAHEGYVPGIMCPGGDGYGDYIVMTIGPDGKIDGWLERELDLHEFGVDEG